VALSTFESATLRIFYEFDLDKYGSIAIDSFTQHNITNEFQASAASEVEEDVGDFADPDWLGTIDVDWTYSDWFVSYRLRWQKSVLIDALEQQLHASSFETTEGTVDGDTVDLYSGNFTNKTDARTISDLSVGYDITDSTRIQLNILNLLDRKPSDAGRIGWAANHFGVDERLGRRFSVRFKHVF
jgi:outer membrane receptor protein involved in Fe transport